MTIGPRSVIIDDQPVAVSDASNFDDRVLPVIGGLSQIRPYIAYLGQGGANVNADFDVDGSVTPVTFKIDAIAEGHIFIRKISVLIVDSVIRNERFGDIPTLTNGVDLTLNVSNDVTYLISRAKIGAHLVAAASDIVAFGGQTTTTATHEILDFGSNDAFMVTFDLRTITEFGVRLARGTTDAIEFIVRDDLTGLVFGSVQAIGVIVIDSSEVGSSFSPGRGPDFPT